MVTISYFSQLKDKNEENDNKSLKDRDGKTHNILNCF